MSGATAGVSSSEPRESASTAALLDKPAVAPNLTIIGRLTSRSGQAANRCPFSLDWFRAGLTEPRRERPTRALARSPDRGTYLVYHRQLSTR
jgi:hypothetical protein